MPSFPFHPPGITIKIIAKDWGTHGRSCYVNHIRRSFLAENVVVYFWRLQILVDDNKKLLPLTMFQMDWLLLCWQSEKQANKVQWAPWMRSCTDKQHPGSSLAVFILVYLKKLLKGWQSAA